jgi:hypothetical protein
LLELKGWLPGHYSEEGELAVFAVAGPPVFDPNSKAKRWDFDIEIPIGPVIIIVCLFLGSCVCKLLTKQPNTHVLS